ncbi:PilT/PilU family type 4a pilus ATPase [Tepidiphilus margaritifer]|uniref:PilT/PilU family type 4a pilus ATPase n=1 Tax=Tepidiphilus margaritifer TaxID=203471 RepID=UPI0004209A4A|nr:PilT/PilU family type 4a pilus ATPase [Tepidiphilus margaritifer]
MPIVTPVLEKLFRAMHDRSASDIFVTAGAPIHIKINGIVMPINQQVMKPEQVRRILEEAIANETLWQRYVERKELNFSLGLSDVGNFRINAFWQRNSPAAVIRYVSRDIPSFETLGLPPVLGEMALGKRGLILVVGPTGSGKSTTLAAMIDHRNSTLPGHILTVEDPIEYLFRHKKSLVNQRDVGIDTLSWGEALKSAMRQAPDCILIGEIRDLETMQAAIAYALTGHLVLASLHANNTYHALNRIVNFYPLESRGLLFSDLSVALRGIIAQRLVRHVQGQRIPAVEILVNSRLIAEMIEKGNLSMIKDAMERSLSPGVQTFDQDLVRLYRNGAITLEEAIAQADSPINLQWELQNAGVQTTIQDGGIPPADVDLPSQMTEIEFPSLASTKT